MSREQIIIFSILGFALVMFAWGRYRHDIVAATTDYQPCIEAVRRCRSDCFKTNPVYEKSNHAHHRPDRGGDCSIGIYE